MSIRYAHHHEVHWWRANILFTRACNTLFCMRRSHEGCHWTRKYFHNIWRISGWSIVIVFASDLHFNRNKLGNLLVDMRTIASANGIWVTLDTNTHRYIADLTIILDIGRGIRTTLIIRRLRNRRGVWTCDAVWMWPMTCTVNTLRMLSLWNRCKPLCRTTQPNRCSFIWLTQLCTRVIHIIRCPLQMQQLRDSRKLPTSIVANLLVNHNH